MNKEKIYKIGRLATLGAALTFPGCSFENQTAKIEQKPTSAPTLKLLVNNPANQILEFEASYFDDSQDATIKEGLNKAAEACRIKNIAYQPNLFVRGATIICEAGTLDTSKIELTK